MTKAMVLHTFVGNGHVCCLILYGHEGCKVRYIYFLLLSLMHSLTCLLCDPI